ncbi:MAG: type I methionyl aminopeptidase [Calditrichia bacterium]|nr:type I methionyl aminopeptidase [Calditrichia bacterium]
MIYLKTKDEISRIKESNQIIAEVLLHIRDFIKPGISTKEIDKEIENFIIRKKAKPAFKGLYGFPSSSCISINDEVVHGIPSKKRILKKGEIIGIDVGVELNNYFGDSAFTFEVDTVSLEVKKLLKVTKESLDLGIEQCNAGKKLGDLGNAVQKHVELNKFNVVREMVGHGVGRKIHEDPQVPNYGKPNQGPEMKEGMVLAIEPMVNMGSHEVYIANDKWTVKTKDGSYSAHFEHSVAITANGPEILSQLNGV